MGLSYIGIVRGYTYIYIGLILENQMATKMGAVRKLLFVV